MLASRFYLNDDSLSFIEEKSIPVLLELGSYVKLSDDNIYIIEDLTYHISDNSVSYFINQ